MDELEFNVRVFSGFIINKSEPSTGSFYGDGNPLLSIYKHDFDDIVGSKPDQSNPYELYSSRVD